jgi:hypothetical protein
MSQKTKDLKAKLMEKAHFRAAWQANVEACEKKQKLIKAMKNLARGGILIPKPNVLRESVEELRELGHAHADHVEKITRRIKR